MLLYSYLVLVTANQASNAWISATGAIAVELRVELGDLDAERYSFRRSASC
jgi:hypothetical protein